MWELQPLTTLRASRPVEGKTLPLPLPVKIFLEELRKTMRNLSTGQFSLRIFETEVVISYTGALILGILNVCLIDRVIYSSACLILREPISFRHNLPDYGEEPRRRFCSSLGALHHPYSASRFHFNEQICNFTA
jgi:hypothetical protein